MRGAVLLAGAIAALASHAVEVRVRETPGGPKIHVDGKPVAPRFFFGSDKAMPSGEVSPFIETVGYCREAGVRFISTGTDFGWCADGEDWSLLDSVCDKILRTHPDALIVPRVVANGADWITERHPDWLMELSDRGKVECPSIFAEGYRDALRAHLAKFVRHLRDRYPNNFAGVHLAAQAYGEFFYYDSRGPWLHGYEPAELVAWRKYLSAHGESDAETAELPSDEERTAHTNGLLLDPVKDRRFIMFEQFEQDAMADFVADLAATIRTASDGKILSVFFYGYGFEHSDTLNGPAHSGTFALGRLLEKAAADIDILAAPLSYVDRKYPAPYLSQGAAESAAKHGVLWLDEDDTRTFLAVEGTADPATLAAGGWTLTTKEETLDQLRRNLSAAIRRGRASWFMDLPSAGWYADRDIWRVVEELRPADMAALGRMSPYDSTVALVLDERGMLCATERSLAAFRPLIYEGRSAFARAGVDFGQYLVDDALSGSVPAKVQVFLSTFFADADMRERIAAQRQARPDLTRVWCWAPGYLGPDGADVENVRLTTGFRVTRIAAANPEVTATSAGRALGLPETLKGIGMVDPLFAVEATDDETLARWPDGSSAIVRRKAGKGYEIFYGIPVWSSDTVKALAKLSPSSSYSDPVPFASVEVADRAVADDPVEVSSMTSAWSEFCAWFRLKVGFLLNIR